MYVADSIGRRQERFGEFADDLFIPLVRSVSDQLSIYNDIRQYARLRVHDVRLWEGAERTYILVGLRDGRGPLRLKDAKQRWAIKLDTSREMELSQHINGRRWRFIDRWLGAFMGPLLSQVSDALAEYYARRPYAKPRVGIIRFLEGIDTTYLCVEIDDRSEQTNREQSGRYRVQ